MDSSITSLLATYGPLGVFCILLLLGWIIPKPLFQKMEAENDLLRRALDLERQRSSDVTAEGLKTAQILDVLRALADQRSQEEPDRRKHRDRGLTWDDITKGSS